MLPSFLLPPCLEGKCSQEDYSHWLNAKAVTHVKRDKKRGNTVCTVDSYRHAIHAAVGNGGD